MDPQPNSIAAPTSTPPLTIPKDKIGIILDERIMLTNEGEIQSFIVHWVGRPYCNCTLVLEETLQQLDPDFLEIYKS